MKQVEVKHSNLRVRLEGILSERSEVGEWRVIGQEQDGALLLCWMSAETSYSEIGLFESDNDSYTVLYKFDSVKNVIQASVNLNRTLIVFSVYEKEDGTDSEEKDKELYSLYLARVKGDHVVEIHAKKQNQIMAQFFYWRKKCPDKFLVMAHQEAIQIFQVEDDEIEAAILKLTAVETIVKAFAWGQWDAIHQSLYFIHYRKPMHRVEGETQPDETELAPTLSALQFHEDMPHETVLNIPLNLPGMAGTGNENNEAICRTYENDAIPLRVHDCSLDVTVVSDSKGILCICHHYLYQPVKPPTTEVMDESTTVHFAYSVTLLHHGHVIHCNIPGIPFSQATTLRPTFTMYNDQHLLVYCPEFFIHMLDIGQKHEPCCHILIGNHSLASNPEVSSRLVTLLHPPVSNLDYNSHTDQLLLNLTTLDVVKLKVTNQQLIDAYKSHDAILENKLSILHYFLIHASEPDIIAELLTPIAEQSMDLDITNIMQEVLVGGAFATVMRSLPSDAQALINLLPFTTVNASTPIQVKVGSKLTMSLTQEDLWNPSVMLLSPRQRLMPYRPDMWTALWDALSAPKEPRFRSATVAEKLMVSLVCYQPEALSRCSTPLSPGGALIGSGGTLSDMAMITGGRTKQGQDPLPFYEVESSAASKQEHVISVNLREVSMHLLKRAKGFDSPMQVHAVATRYAAAQLESSHLICHLATKSAAIDTVHQERGFPLVNALEEGKRLVLFSVMERYNLAVESLAFPLPQGFPSFMAYLGYRTLPFPVFLQYVQASVLQLQVDVMKAIIADLPESGEGLMKKLRLLQLLPRSRARRLLNGWSHPASLMIRAREHTLNILSGVEGAHNRGHPHHNRIRNQAINRGLAAFPSADRLSPLDTFLDLLTAKASLAELDFTLLVEATMASTEEFLE